MRKAFRPDNLPKTIKEPTYLEICKYPRRRFEEICSRLLCFYIAPKNEHGFNDLFLSSLLELLATEKISFKDEQKIRHKLFDIELEAGQTIATFVYSIADWNSRFSVTPLYLNIQREGVYL